MNFDFLNWTNGLDQTGWIAAGLFIVFFIIALITVVMMIKLRSENRKRNSKPLKPINETEASKPKQKKAAPAPAKPAVMTSSPAQGKPAAKIDEETDPVEQAEIYITYGLYQQAIDLLEKHLNTKPTDIKANELLKRAQAKTGQTQSEIGQ